MNNITNLLALEDTNIIISDIQIQGQTKTITWDTTDSPFLSFMRIHNAFPRCEWENNQASVLQDNYALIHILKQRRWRCTDPECLYNTSETYKFVNKQRKTTNVTDMLIIDDYKNLLKTAASIAKWFHVPTSYAHEFFERYVKPLTDAISVNEVFLDMDDNCKNTLVI